MEEEWEGGVGVKTTGFEGDRHHFRSSSSLAAGLTKGAVAGAEIGRAHV